jgi:hypothetical protein
MILGLASLCNAQTREIKPKGIFKEIDVVFKCERIFTVLIMASKVKEIDQSSYN